ncbi:RNase H domain-containing protein [Hirsutella rhossiliensis]|uniref:RNase H domain-containing protein n=1 Tax=Hirsutella rhossiliensis TaxID=111463 RepID=A0A9P8MZV4_9HYPO|nr:RNase H domain-containing protein [Hirsutella rhossiliensis]KAH0964290.1 RNase H domain-containing protein [Hirsutella rhossiliensis]
MRWLGIWLDSTLTFKTHVEKWTAKAQAVAYHLKGLTNTNRGPLPGAVRRAVRACIEPQLFFGAEAWYPGMTCPRWNKPAKEGPSRIRHLIRRMDKSLNTAMRAILPVWKTTPLSARHREAGIPPVSHLLQACRTRFAARLKSLDEAHPLARPRQPFRTRLRRTDELLPRCARPDLLAQSAANFGEWLQSVAPRTAIVYSDGSLSRRSRGYGYAVHQDGLTVLSGNGRLGLAEVFDAEARLPRGLRAALSLPAADQIVVCLDNLAVATCLQGMPSDSSQKEFLEFQALAAEHGATEIRWIPGHTNIPGNEQADALAKAGTSTRACRRSPTLAYLRKVARQRPKDAFKAWWEVSAPQQTHHGDFADYHERLNHDDARLTCSCGSNRFPPSLPFVCTHPIFSYPTRPGGGCSRNRPCEAKTKDMAVAPERPADGQQAEQRSAFEPMKC